MAKRTVRTSPRRRARVALAFSVLLAAVVFAISLLRGVPSDWVTVVHALGPQSLPQSAPVNAPAASQHLDILLAEMDAAWKANDWSKSAALLEEMLGITPSDTLLRSQLYQAYVNDGWRLLSEQQLPQAHERFVSALQIEPRSSEAQAGLRLLEQLTGGGIIQGNAPVETKVQITSQVSGVAAAPSAPPQGPSSSPPICQAACVPVCPTPCPPVCVPVCPTPCPPVCAPACPAPCPSICVVACQACCPLVCAPACPTTFLPASSACCPVPAAPTLCTRRVHVVQRGDTLFRLAIQFNTTVRVLMDINGLTTTTIRVGQVLVVP